MNAIRHLILGILLATSMIPTIAQSSQQNYSVEPNTELVLGSDGNFYGTTYSSTSAFTGINNVFRVLPSGQVQNVYTFGSQLSPLTLGADGNLYGISFNGSTGTAYKLTLNGQLSVISTFSDTVFINGIVPALSEVNINLFVGSNIDFNNPTYSQGTVFNLNPNGTRTIIGGFNGPSTTDAAYPNGAILANDGNYYGTCIYNESSTFQQNGCIFKITPSGIKTILVNFNGTNGAACDYSVIQGTDGKLYGVTEGGGASNMGTVFACTLDGTLTTLASFTGANGNAPFCTLTQASDGNFYGTTEKGGINNLGTVFQITPSGTLTSLFSFSGVNGSYPQAGVAEAADGSLWGTTTTGGSNNLGTVFKITKSGTFTSLYSFEANPIITVQPASQTIALGSSVTFSVTVSSPGGSQLSYQWLKNGSPIAGATGARYTISNVKLSDDASYSVVVTNASGSTISSSAMLDVDDSVGTGQTVTFSANNPSSGGPFTYQFEMNGTPIPGATAASYTISDVTEANSGNYTVIISNSGGVVASETYVLVVSETETPTMPPWGLAVLAALLVFFTARGLKLHTE